MTTLNWDDLKLCARRDGDERSVQLYEHAAGGYYVVTRTERGGYYNYSASTAFGDYETAHHFYCKD